MSSVETIEYPDAANIAARVEAVAGVAGLSGGHFGEVALLFPGHRVPGLRLDRSGHLQVHLIADLDSVTDLHALADAVRAAIAADITATPIDVIIADAVAQPR